MDYMWKTAIAIGKDFGCWTVELPKLVSDRSTNKRSNIAQKNMNGHYGNARAETFEHWEY